MTALGELPVDLTGRVTGWARLEQGGHRWAGHQPVGVLDPEVPLTLVPVPARTVNVQLVVEGLDAPLEIAVPVSLTVPAQFLLRTLASWLELPGEGWALWVDDTALLPYQILDDFGVEPHSNVVVKR
jgi:hypothetical protein